MTLILHVTPSYKPAYVYGGPTFSISRLCEELQEAHTSFRIKVLSTTANGKGELDVSTLDVTNVSGVEVAFFKRITGDHTHVSPALLKGLISTIKASRKQSRPLIIHIHSWWNAVAILALAIGRLYGVPVVLSPRGTLTRYSLSNRHPFLKYCTYYLLTKPLLSRCHLHATSAGEHEEIKTMGIRYQKVHTIPNLPTFHTKRSLDDRLQVSGGLSMIFLSRIEQKKGLDILFEALSLVKIKWHLNIVGDGDQTYINHLVRRSIELKIANHIIWHESIYQEEKFKFMQRHDALILTSYTENFANVVLESLSVGTAVIVSEKVGLADYVKSNNFGWVTSLSAGHIAATITSAAEDIEKRWHIRAAAPAKIRHHFNEERIVADYIKMYLSIIKHEN